MNNSSTGGGEEDYYSYAKKQRLKNSVLLGSSFFIWALISFYCLTQYSKKHKEDWMHFPFLTFVINTAAATMGTTEFCKRICYYDDPCFNSNVLDEEDIMFSMRVLLNVHLVTLGIPAISTELWLKHKVAQKEIAWIHMGIGMIPSYIYLIQHYTRQDLIDLTVVLNMVSLAAVGIIYGNYFAVLAAATVFVAFCIIKRRPEISYDILSKQIFNYTMGVFVFCSLKAVE